MARITGLTFENSYCGTFTTFHGRYNGKFFVGNNEDGHFKVGNYRDFYRYELDQIEKYVTEQYNKLVISK